MCIISGESIRSAFRMLASTSALAVLITHLANLLARPKIMLDFLLLALSPLPPPRWITINVVIAPTRRRRTQNRINFHWIFSVFCNFASTTRHAPRSLSATVCYFRWDRPVSQKSNGRCGNVRGHLAKSAQCHEQQSEGGNYTLKLCFEQRYWIDLFAPFRRSMKPTLKKKSRSFSDFAIK